MTDKKDDPDGKPAAGGSRGIESHLIPAHALNITAQQFASFLYARKRSTQCPLCTHNGDWIIHGGDPDGSGDMVHVYALPHPAGTGYALPMIMMECPQCAFLYYTNAATVIDFLGEQGRD